jgi:WD40 repeat protein
MALLMPTHCATGDASARPRTDAHGDPLPEGALARLGTVRFRVPPWTYSIALSRDGKLLAAADYEGVAFLSTETGNEVRRIECRMNGGFSVGAPFRFSPNGKQLVVCNDGGLSMFDVAKGEVSDTYSDEGVRNRASVSISADGKLLALAEDRSKHKLLVRLWDIAAK